MNAVVYLFQVSACMGVFYLFYYLLLSRFTFFTINRWYLIVTLVICFVIPLLTITVQHQETYPQLVQKMVYVNAMQNLPQAELAAAIPALPESPMTWMTLLKLLYMVAVTVMFVRLTLMVVKFFMQVKRNKSTKIDGVHIVEGDDKISNGSFFNFIFLNDDELSEDELQQIIAHEMLHVKLYHSVDRILVKIAHVFLWFNPFVYLYARAIEENHEFEVDRSVSNSNDRNKYAELLLHLSVARQGALYHNFSMVPLKKRITMLFTKPTNHMKKVIYLLVVPVVLISCLAFAKIKKGDIKNFNLAKAGREVLSVIKSGQENVIEQLNQPVQLPAVISNATNVNDAVINQSDAVTSVPTDTARYSVFGNVSKDTKLIIDGKEHPNELLYEISNNGFAGINVISSPNGQTIDIKTTDGKIIYLTALEKDNLRRERTIPENQFYSRIALTRQNGERYDFIRVNTHNVSNRIFAKHGKRVPPNYKVGFKINGQVYDEEELKTISPGLISSLGGIAWAEYGPETLYQNKYNLLLTFTTSYFEKLADTASTAKRFAAGTRYVDNLQPGVVSGDTIVYKLPAYKVEDYARLNDVINILPNFRIANNEVFISNKKIYTVMVDGKLSPGGVQEALTFPAVFFDKVEVLNNTAMNFVMKPEHKQSINIQNR